MNYGRVNYKKHAMRTWSTFCYIWRFMYQSEKLCFTFKKEEYEKIGKIMENIPCRKWGSRLFFFFFFFDASLIILIPHLSTKVNYLQFWWVCINCTWSPHLSTKVHYLQLWWVCSLLLDWLDSSKWVLFPYP